MDTRWHRLYLEDARARTAPPTRCGRDAAGAFRSAGVRSVLDVACGAGRDSHHLAQRGVRVIGIDATERALALARSAGAGPAFVQGDARRLPFAAAAFDGVYCFGLLHEYTGPDRADSVARTMAEIFRVMKPGGLLFLAVLAGRPADGLPHVWLFTTDAFAEATRAFEPLARDTYDDVGCTGSRRYRVTRGILRRPRRNARL